MNLNDYQCTRNPRGMHGTGDNHLRWNEWGLGWIKMAFEDNTGVSWAAHALEKGMTPICRIYRWQLSGRPADETLMRQYFEYINAGVKWFEFYNEPNLPYEWYDGVDLRPDNRDLMAALCDNWLTWAEAIANAGGYPGFIPLSETNEPWGETIPWMKALLTYMAEVHYSRFQNIINSGMWLSVHPYIMNHWYQEVPGGGGLSARGHESVNIAEGGWHFEYPYDPICQADDPGRTVWGGTAKQAAGDVYGVLGSGIVWLELLQQMFGVGWIPVVGTEGGIWRIPSEDGDITYQQDPRYPAYDLHSHAHGTVAMFNWIAEQAPPWMFGIAAWEYDSYWRNGNPIPAVGLLASNPPRMRPTPPAIPALGSAPPPWTGETSVVVAQQPTQEPIQEIQPAQPTQPPPPTLIPTPLGPGPVHGSPTHHFVLVAPALESLLFETVGLRDYWAVFKPMLIMDVNLIDFIPNSASLGLTLIVPPNESAATQASILARWPNVFLDILEASDSGMLETVLIRRVLNNTPFG